MLERGGIVIDLDTRTFKEEKLSNAQKLAIYRIAQEQCTNIAKYANASRVSINLEMIDDNFFLRIADDGNGADNNEQTNGIGLRNISARATVFGGNTRIITSPNQGFFLEVFFPLKP